MTLHRENMLLRNVDALDQCFSKFSSIATVTKQKQVLLPLLQYKTFTRTTIAIKNRYTYHYYNTQHLHVPLLQYKTYTPTTIAIHKMHTNYYYSTKHVHLSPLQYTTCNLPLLK